MFDSLRSRLLLILPGLLTLMTVAMGYAALGAMQRDSQAQAQQSLNVASRVFREALSNRTSQLSHSAQLVASDFAFRQAVALREQDTIASVLENHGQRINASMTILLTPEGELVAASDSQISQQQLGQLVQDVRQSNQQPVADIVFINGKALQMVLVPVRAPAVIAWAGMGFLLDKQLAGQIKALTDLDISFVYQPGEMDAQVLATTLPTQHNPLQPDPGQILTDEVKLDPAGTMLARLHLSTWRWQQSYQQARDQLLLIFGISLLLALLVAISFARSITKPILQLTDFARRIGLGEQPSAPAAHYGEVGVLSNTLQKMRDALTQREQQILFQARHDSLTGLVNRHWVESRLPELLQQQRLWLLLLNIKDFKHINDAFGYQNGDALLLQLTQRLQQLQWPLELLARIGGDEFLLVSSQPLDLPHAEVLQQQLSHDFALAGSRLNLKLAMALYPVPPGDVSANNALRRVDISMAHAKQMPGLIACYQTGQDESHQRELTLLHDLPLSLQSGQMFVVYQPKVELARQKACSAEALIRWQHPQLGFVPPDEFIRLAEHSGLISRVTDWMIAQVIRQLSDWRQQGIDLTVAVNLSAHDLLSEDLPGQIDALLQLHQLPATALALEVTEGAVMQDPQQVIHNLQRLRQMGITLAIDDFGTGQSSLAYLKRLPVHEVKIDRAFVKDIEHNSNDVLIVSTTSELAHGLGLQVTAEGLENLAGLALLQQAGVDKVQGYYFAKPLRAGDFTQWVQQFNQDASQWFTQPQA